MTPRRVEPNRENARVKRVRCSCGTSHVLSTKLVGTVRCWGCESALAVGRRGNARLVEVEVIRG